MRCLAAIILARLSDDWIERNAQRTWNVPVQTLHRNDITIR